MSSDPPSVPSPSTPAEPDPRQRILDAAESVFAEKGMAGARVANIAELAGVNKAMLYYYYGNKEALYDAVIDRTAGQIGALADTTLAHASSNPTQALRAFLDGYRAIILARPQFIRIMMREMLDGGERVQRLFVPRVAAIWQKAFPGLAQGKLDGCFNPKVHPGFVPMVLISPFITFNIFSTVFKNFIGMHPDDIRTLYMQTADAILLEGLLARDPAEARP